MTRVHIGSGAGFAGDRFDAAVPVVETLARLDGPRFLIFETLAERTLALAQQQRLNDPERGYSPWLERYLRPVLARCNAAGVRIVSNLGAANPEAGARAVLALAADLEIPDLRVAVVLGDDLLSLLGAEAIRALPTMEGIDLDEREIVAANAYLGAGPVAAALAMGADVVLVGRTTDAALVLGPLLHAFGWTRRSLDRIAAGTLAGHLMECGAQVSGGYFADPGLKDVPGLARVGFPIASVGRDGAIEIGKADGTGGRVDRATVIEQMLYEVHDPAAYLTPDVTLDLTRVRVAAIGPDRVLVSGARGGPPPATLKATVSVDNGWLGEGEITYCGPNALARAQLARDVLRERCARLGVNVPVRIEILGLGAVHDDDRGMLAARRADEADPLAYGEYRLRAAVRGGDRAMAQAVSDEVLSLYCSGPAAGGGVRQAVTPQIATASVLVPREQVEPHVTVREITS